ncbi:hypothetical protein BGW36DRAFT_303951 [Talaromyces proteolyticus]|uniref:Lytic polysaccharide monooxygenase n=1 Tax=Talaromyces proteolyticus TaxID=1131652 RepID=A0AAD4KIF6_9EURO|nr:uncharacterized protein BGW36DRAFT_303951 [Talaromyces proteolyticus]KAH8691869.1 hypothetical protein BGW36DRAFT_303951 [Talaromyces proteolyticus]
MWSLFAIWVVFVHHILAHIQMSNPYPIRSPLDPENGDNRDYSYTNPLSASGSDFPCKGYQSDPFRPTATYAAGGQYQLSLQGSATHGGGSCQLSLSYDTGKTFTVIKSIEGGCPLTSTYEFTIPSDAPLGKALFVWTWFNKIGNREMYMNCAQVIIEQGPANKFSPRKEQHARQMVSYSSRPSIFIANVHGPGECVTIAGDEVKFPEPGPDVEGSVTGVGYTCSVVANPPQLLYGDLSTPTSTYVTSIQSTILGLSSMSTSCSTNGAIICGATGQTWSVCNDGTVTSMGSVAAGTSCKDGVIS